jgi:hypothetical protein
VETITQQTGDTVAASKVIGQDPASGSSVAEGSGAKLETGGWPRYRRRMADLPSAQDLFKGRHFDREIIILCVRWYLTFKLSSRDLVQMMAERGI